MNYLKDLFSKLIINMQFEEKFDIIKLKYLQTLSLEDYLKSVTKEDALVIKTKIQREGEYNYFKTFLKNMIKHNGKIKRVYKQIDERGRYYCVEGVQMRPSAIRGFLLDGIGTDIDMVNCHPNILRYICKKNDILCPNLEYYVNNRSTMIKANPSIKYEIISYINGSNSKTSNEFVKNFKQECKTIHENLKKLEAYKNYLDSAIQSEKKNNIGTAIFSVMEDMEVDIITNVIGHLTKKKIDIVVLMHDGLIIKGNFYDDTDLLKELEDVCENIYCGLNMKFSYKHHDLKIKLPSDYDPCSDSDEEPDDTKGGLNLNDYDVSELIIQEHDGLVINDNGTLYGYHNHIWTTDLITMFREWFRKSKINTVGNPKKPPIYVREKTKTWPLYIIQLMSFYESNLKPQYILNVETGKIPFEDGIYNMASKTFTEYSSNNIHYFSYHVLRKFPTDRSGIDFVKESLLNIFNGNEETFKEFFSFVCRALGKHTSDKLSLFAIGDRNSGKSCILDLIKDSFNGIIGGLMAKELSPTSKSFESVEIQYGFMSEMCENVLCLSSELKPSDKIDGTLWRTLVSGGDTITFRKKFGKTTRSTIMALPIFFMNDIPSFDQPDSAKTAIAFDMPCTFSNVVNSDVSENGLVCKLAISGLKDILKEQKYLDAFTLIVLDHYSIIAPSYSIFKETMAGYVELDDEASSNGLLKKAILEKFKINAIGRDDMPVTEVHKLLKYNKAFRPSKIKNVLANLGVKSIIIRGTHYYRGIAVSNTGEMGETGEV